MHSVFRLYELGKCMMTLWKKRKKYWEYPAIRVLQIMWSARALTDSELKFRLRASTK